MKYPTPEQIKEISEVLDCGFRCFWHKTNGELLIIPDTVKNYGMDMEAWEEDMDKLDENFTDYAEINQMESGDSFEIMEEFVETLPNSNKLKARLIGVLGRNKPFRNFKNVIDDSGDYRDEWFAFKDLKMQEWVIKRLDRIIDMGNTDFIDDDEITETHNDDDDDDDPETHHRASL